MTTSEDAVTPTRVTPVDRGASLPSTRLYIDGDHPDALGEIRHHLGLLAEKGERPWAEVVYSPPEELTEEQSATWLASVEDTFDAVELVDGEIVTLPPYSELVAI
uniref:Uncharacterized protein n=2 Tax=unclassified bacterial viruses TaxID=12333 RepID=A0AAU7J7Z0_9VIRU